jgi:NADPH-dependent 2,4-dienoyl-CoA reductase/sulfur reductase-like enzyme
LDHRVTAIDVGGKTVVGVTSSGETFQVPYEKLLIATGARPRKLDVPGGDLPGVKMLKSLQDGREIKNYLATNDVKRALIVGMGYIGLEMAEAFHERGVQVHMIEMMPRLLPYLPHEMAELVVKELTDKGIHVHLGCRVTSIVQDGAQMRVAFDGDEVAVELVLAGVGIVPNSEIAAEAGLQLGPSNAVAVDRGLRTSEPDIYAAGDCADAFHVVSNRRVWIPLALRANRAGWAVGDNVTGGHVELPGVAGTAVFKVLDLEVARTGLSIEEARKAGFDAVENAIKSRSRAHAHPGNQTIHVNLVADRNTGKLLGGCMVGKEAVAHRIDAVAVALHAGMTVDEFFQCDMAYAPPFSPVWDPMLTAANQLLRKLA